MRSQHGGVLKYFDITTCCHRPHNTQESEGTQVAKWEYNSKLEPAAAESWESNDDATQWTFHIRKDCKFHNGDTVKAEDFKRAFERICDPTMKTLGRCLPPRPRQGRQGDAGGRGRRDLRRHVPG